MTRTGPSGRIVGLLATRSVLYAVPMIVDRVASVAPRVPVPGARVMPMAREGYRETN